MERSKLSRNYVGDRYDSEPRSKSMFESGRSLYDDDSRGPIRPYSDKTNDEESFRDTKKTTKDTDKEEEEHG